MQTDVISTEEANVKGQDNTAEEPPGPRRWPVLVLLLLLLIGASGYFYLQLRSSQAGVDEQSAQVRAPLSNTTEQLAGLKQQTDSLAMSLQAMDARLDKLRLDFAALHQHNNSDAGWALAEVRHLLVMASHRLLLERDITAALPALQTADQQLQQLPDPALLAVRQPLMTTINDLIAIEQIDIPALSLFLGDLAHRTHRLPLNTMILTASETIAVQTDESPPASGWWDLPGLIWQELKSLVHVSRAGEQAVATLLPEQRYFLYQNLRLQAESARLAVLLGDEPAFKDAVQLIISWLQQYFDTQDNEVLAALDSLERMLVMELDYAVPSLSHAIAALDAYIASQSEQRRSMTATDE